jgi:hypothetical protein
MEQEKPIQITNVRPESVWVEGGSPSPGYRVEFTTPSGVHTYVHVPRSDSLRDDVAAAVEEEAAKLEELVKLYPRSPRGPSVT